MGFCSIPTHFLGVPSVARVRSSCPAVVGCAGLAAGTLGGAVVTGRESVPSESVLLIQALARALGRNPKKHIPSFGSSVVTVTGRRKRGKVKFLVLGPKHPSAAGSCRKKPAGDLRW